MSAYKNNRLWVLGGNDGEMEVIKTLLGMRGEKWVQPGREWGFCEYTPTQIGLKSSIVGCGDELSPFLKIDAVPRLDTIYFVECAPLGEWSSIGIRVIDHHGVRSNEPASVLQVLDILEKSGLRISWQTRRWIELVAANDCGAYAGMEALGATEEEMVRVREFTSNAQGITAHQKKEAFDGVGGAKLVEKVWVVRINHDKFAPVVDEFRKRFGGRENLLVVSAVGKIHFFGYGAISARLHNALGGWAGGAGLGVEGDVRSYWGMNIPQPKENLNLTLDRVLVQINQ